MESLRIMSGVKSFRSKQKEKNVKHLFCDVLFTDYFVGRHFVNTVKLSS